jgi:5-methylcytosine-specific restriction endonuclease McrA
MINRNTIKRLTILGKYGSKCAYCGNEITLKTMQVDHIWPQRAGYKPDHSFENLNPSCRRCNHYKRAETLQHFRHMMITLHERIRKNYICKVAEDYGIMIIKPFDGRFYFEKEEQK